MAKRVNKTLIGVMTAVAFVLMTVAGVLMVHRLQQTDPRHYAERAERYAAESDWEQAKLYYFRAYSVSQDATYRVLAGQMLYEQGHEGLAVQLWMQAVAAEPHLVEGHEKILDVRLEIADLYEQPSGWRILRDAAQTLLGVDEQNAKGLYCLGRAMAKLAQNLPDENAAKDQVRAGVANVRRAAELAPEVVKYSLTLANFEHLSGRNDEAERILKRLIANTQTAGKNAATVRYSYARFLAAVGRPDEAVKFYEQAETFAGDDRQTLATAKSQHAQFWIGRWYKVVRESEPDERTQSYYDKARSLLEESIALHDTGFLPYMLLAELFSFQGDLLEAIEICEQRTQKSIQRVGIKTHQRKIGLYMLLLEAADQCLAYASDLDQNSPEFDEIIAKAQHFANEASAEFADLGPGLHTLGKIRLAQGQELEAINAFQKAAEAYGKPNWRNSLVYAELLARNGQPGAAKTAISDAILDPSADPTCWLTYARILLATGENTLALQTADEFLRRDPRNRTGLEVKMNALRRLGQTELAERIRKAYLPQNDLAEAQNKYLEGRVEQALTILDRLLGAQPDNIQYLRFTVSILTERNEHDRAMAHVRRALEAAPDNLDIRFLETVADPTRSPEDRRRAQFEIISQLPDPFLRQYQLCLWYRQFGPPDKYIDALREAERLLMAPDRKMHRAVQRRYLRDLIERQFTHASAVADNDLIEAIVQKAVKENIDGADGLTYRGRAHMIARSPELALNSFKLALEQQPTDARTLTFIGQCHIALEPPQIFEGKAYFERAVAANPNMGAAQKGLAIIARHNGDEAAFQRRLAICQKLIPTDIWVQEQMLTQREKTTPLVGIQRRELIRTNKPNDVENLLTLANLYERIGKTEKAIECFDEALAVPDVPTSAILAATKFFRDSGRADRALSVLQDRVASTQGDAEKANASLLIVNHWRELDDRAKVEESFRRATEYAETLRVCSAYATFKSGIGDFSSALQWYTRAIEVAKDASPQLIGQLLRARIDVHFRAGDFDAAERESQEYFVRYPDDPAAQLLRTAVFTVQGKIDDAILSLDRYLEDRPNNLNAMLQRSRLYGAQGRWARATADLERLRSIDPAYRNYAPRILLADGYAITNRLELAFRELESVLEIDSSANAVAAHLIILYREHERPADAIRICTSMSNRNPANPVWVKNRADIKDQLGDLRAAVRDHEIAARLSDYHPHFTSALLDAYAKLDQLETGLAYYNQTIPQENRTPEVMVRHAKLLALSDRPDEAVAQFLSAQDTQGFADLGFIRSLVLAVAEAFEADQAIDTFRADPSDPRLKKSSQHILAMLLNHFERDSEALAALETLFEAADNDAEKTALLAALGEVHERRLDWKRARETYETLLEIDDKNVIGLNNLAFLLSDKLARPRDAIPYAHRASILHGIPTVRDTLAWTHVQLGEYRKAIGILTKVLEDRPRFVPGIYHLAEAYRRSGELQKAFALLESARNLITEGIGESYRDKVTKSFNEVRNALASP